MATLRLLQPYAGKRPGDTITVDNDQEARWLVGIGRATSDEYPAHQQRAVSPGSRGADPLAGGDPTRRYGHAAPSVPTRGNDAWPVPGSPIQYNRGVAPNTEPVPPNEATGRQRAKDAARANRERPAGSPGLEGPAPAGEQVAPETGTAGPSEDKPAARKSKS